jgi:signal transduction histidine kinase
VTLSTASVRTGQLRRLLRLPAVGDTVVAAVAFGLTLQLMNSGSAGHRNLDGLGVLLAAIACFPLLWHRRAPLAVFALCTVASAAIEGLNYVMSPPFGPTVALLYLAGDRRTADRLRQTGLVVVGLGAAHLGAATIGNGKFPAIAILGAAVLWGGAWIIGDQLRQRRQRRADRVVRARQAEREIQRERRMAAAEERTRIARDLHDSAAHAINVILVQAGGARLLQERDPAAVHRALSTIEDVARETIGEIDQLIRGLREDGPGDGTRAEIEPPIGLAGAGTLADRHRAAGLPVDIRVDGVPRTLAPGLDQAAYRILQESLTNVARHGGGPAHVKIAYGEHELTLTVNNLLGSPANGASEPGEHGGHGILGMRERAMLLGGSLEAGRSNGWFVVHASLPYAPVAQAAR